MSVGVVDSVAAAMMAGRHPRLQLREHVRSVGGHEAREFLRPVEDDMNLRLFTCRVRRCTFLDHQKTLPVGRNIEVRGGIDCP